MSCFGGEEVEKVSRADLKEIYRQGLVFAKHQKWLLYYCIIARSGIYLFKKDAECTQALSMITFEEQEFKMSDIAQQGKFLFEVLSNKRHYIFDCANFTEKDEWKKAITKARADHGSNAAVDSFVMKADIKIQVKEAKDLPAVGNPYCKLICGQKIVTTKVKTQTQKPQFNEEFDFQVSTLPLELLVLMYDNKGGNNDEVIGSTSVKIEVAGERGDQREWLDIRPVKQGEKSKGKIFLIVRTRYDAETLSKVTFGVRLGDLMKRPQHQDSILPDIAFKCLRVLYQKALELQGVFRVPGNKNKMRDYELRFDREGTSVDFVKSDDEHMVASIFKMFLRDLPEPVMPYSLFEQTVEATTKPSKQEIINAIQDVLKQLPKENYRTINITCFLLYKITLHVEKNLMKPTNLAIVFGPVFCAAPPSDEVTKQKMVEKLPALSSAAEYMISDYPAIFNLKQGENPLDDLIQTNNSMSGYSNLSRDRQYGTLLLNDSFAQQEQQQVQ